MVDPFEASARAGVEAATAWGRALEDATADTTIAVQTLTSTGDGMGGSTDGWTTVITFTGRVRTSERQPQSVNIAGGMRVSQLFEVVGPTGISVSPNARLVANGVTYAVIADDEPRSQSTASHILCYEV